MTPTVRDPGPIVSSRSGFTLTELLVSMSILALIILMVAQVTSGATRAIGNSGKHIDSDTEARIIFNRMAVDLAKMLKRSEVDYTSLKQPAGQLDSRYGSTPTLANTQTGGNDWLAFYSEVSGSGTVTGGKKSTSSLIGYTISGDPSRQTATQASVPVLWRLTEATGWEPDGINNDWKSSSNLPVTIAMQWPTLFTFTASSTAPYNVPGNANFTPVGYQVARLEYTYLLKANIREMKPAKLSPTPWWDSRMATVPHTSVDGLKDVSAIVVTIAIVSSTSRTIIASYTKLTSAFPDAVDAEDDYILPPDYKGDVAQAWNSIVNSSSFASDAGIPAIAADSVHIYQRYFYLNTLSEL